ncbi:unnamed protein product [Gordionus sp. m RMFG-2023]
MEKSFHNHKIPRLASCVKISDQRFEVVFGYDKDLIIIFKTISSNRYDPVKKRWNFSLTDHQKLIKACTILEPHITFKSGIEGCLLLGKDYDIIETQFNIAQAPKDNIDVNNNKNGLNKCLLFSQITLGKCILKSPKRFDVESSFNQKLINIFKTIPSKIYDPATKKWSFAINDHDRLMNAVQCLKPEVKIDGLPSFIISTFLDNKKCSHKKLKTEHLCSQESSASSNSQITLNPEKSNDLDDKNESEEDKDSPEENIFKKIDPFLVSSLFPFQREGIKMGIIKNEGRILLADDMGLGKTIQALGIAHYYREDWPLLIVCPSSVRFQWLESIKRWVPSIPHKEINVITSSAACSNSRNADLGLITITSYDWLARQQGISKKLCESVNNQIKDCRSIILDESHFIKNSKAVRCKTVMTIVKNCSRVILCSGTPALSRPEELYTQIKCVDKRMFPSFHDYCLRYCDAKRNNWGWDYSGSSNMNELQILLENRIMIRRMKEDVLDELPRKSRFMVLLDTKSLAAKSSKSLNHWAKAMENNKLKGMEKRGALLQYFKETALAKSPAVVNYISDFLECQEKFIVFSHHKAMIKSIHDFLDQEDINHVVIDGKTSSEARQQNCNEFQNKPKCRVALLSITAANAGINLTSAKTVIFAELFWNPGILVQAEDRAYRIGQENDVVIQYLVAKNTADDFIWPLVKSKLKVLQGAGLTNEDFSKANTHQQICEDKTQTKIMDFWDKVLSEENWEEFDDD